MDIPIGSLVGELRLEDNLTPALQKARQQLEVASSGMQAFGRNLDTVGRQSVSAGLLIGRIGDRLTAVTLPFAAAGVASAKFAAEFETNLTKLITVAGESKDAIAGIREEVFKLGPEVGKGPRELSDALYSIESVGIRGAKGLDVLDRSAKASAVGLGDTAEIARALSAAISNYGDQGLTAAQATDQLLAAVREGGAEADQFARTLGRVIAPAKLVGIGFDEVVASVATFTRLGVRADEAVTALRGTLGVLLKPAAQTRDALLSIGTSIEQVRESVRTSGLANTLIDLVRLTGENDGEIGKIIPNIRALAGVLANAGSQADAYREILGKVKNSTGELDTAFNTVSQTAQFKFNRLLAQLEEVAINLGDKLLPVFSNFVDAIQPVFTIVDKLIGAFGKLPQPIQTAAIALGGLAVAIGPVLSFGGRLIEGLGLIASGAAGIIRTIPGGISVLEGLSNAYRGVASSIFFHTTATRANTEALGENVLAARVAGQAQDQYSVMMAASRKIAEANTQAAIRAETEYATTMATAVASATQAATAAQAEYNAMMLASQKIAKETAVVAEAAAIAQRNASAAATVAQMRTVTGGTGTFSSATTTESFAQNAIILANAKKAEDAIRSEAEAIDILIGKQTLAEAWATKLNRQRESAIASETLLGAEAGKLSRVRQEEAAAIDILIGRETLAEAWGAKLARQKSEALAAETLLGVEIGKTSIARQSEVEAIDILLGKTTAKEAADIAAATAAREAAAATILLGKESTVAASGVELLGGGLATAAAATGVFIAGFAGMEVVARATGQTDEFHSALGKLVGMLTDAGSLIKTGFLSQIEVVKTAFYDTVDALRGFEQLPVIGGLFKQFGNDLRDQIKYANDVADAYHKIAVAAREAADGQYYYNRGRSQSPANTSVVFGSDRDIVLPGTPEQIASFQSNLDKLFTKNFPELQQWQTKFKNPILFGIEQDGKNITGFQKILGGLHNDIGVNEEDLRRAKEAIKNLGSEYERIVKGIQLKTPSTSSERLTQLFVQQGNSLHIAEVATQLLTEEVNKTTSASRSHQKAIEDVNASYQELTDTQKEAIRSLTLLHNSDSTIAKDLGINISQVRAYKTELKEIPEAIDDIYKVSQRLADISDKFDLRDMVDNIKDGIKIVQERMENFSDAMDQYADRLALAQMTGSRRALAEIEQNRRREISGLKDATDAQKALVNDYWDFVAKKAAGSADTFQFRLSDEGIKSVEELTQAAGIAMQDFELMKGAIDESNNALYTSAQIMDKWDDVTKKATATMGVFGQGLSKWIGAIPGLLQQALTGGGGFTGFAKSLFSMIGSDIGKAAFTPDVGIFGGITKKLVGTWDKELGKFVGGFGGLFGKALGFALPGIGAAIGAFAGPLIEKFVGLFHKPEWKQVSNAIKSQFGEISDTLAKQITDLENSIVGGTEKQRRELAGLLSLDKIIGEQGGLNPTNLKKFEQAAIGLFDTIAAGGAQAGKAQDELNTLVKMFTDQADKTGGLWDKNLKAIIDKTKDLKLNIESVNAAIEAQQSKLSTSFGKVVAGFTAPLQNSFVNSLRNLQVPEDLAKGIWDSLGDPKALEDAVSKANDALDHLDIQLNIQDVIKNAVDGAQVEFDRLSRMGLSSFNALVASDKSEYDAIIALEDPIKQLIEAHDKLGLSGSAAYDSLVNAYSKIVNNKELVESVAALNDQLVATENLVGVTAAEFADYQAQTVANYGKLTDASFTSNEALRQVEPILETIIKLHNDRGLAIDDETQKIIDAAREQGILGEEAMSLNDILREGLSALIKGFGFDLPESFKKMAKAAEDAAAKAKKSIDDIPDSVNVDVNVDYPAPPEGWDAWIASHSSEGPGGFSGDAQNPDTQVAWTGGMLTGGKLIPFPMFQAAHMAEGGPVGAAPSISSKVVTFVPKGSDRVPIMADPSEIILNAAMQKNVASNLTKSEVFTVKINNEEQKKSVEDLSVHIRSLTDTINQVTNQVYRIFASATEIAKSIVQTNQSITQVAAQQQAAAQPQTAPAVQSNSILSGGVHRPPMQPIVITPEAAQASLDRIAARTGGNTGIFGGVLAKIVTSGQSLTLGQNQEASPAWMGGQASMIQAAHMAEGGALSSARQLSTKVIAFQPKNSDRIPIMADPSEIILNTAMQRNVAAHLVNQDDSRHNAVTNISQAQLKATGTEGKVFNRGAFEGIFKGANITKENMEEYVDRFIEVINRNPKGRRTRLRRAMKVRDDQ